ncbi:carbohydrate binding family 9 domain-containing protein [Candidatus Poribacteria bacterium]|nr:carbohydrate binding family 9 domain-containing protein [Candidatus Poribacteria bacterium]MYK93281.1 carbohydrate binding family 9 domain-containing protein [Candidatus Poribacteria bacterium]
MIVIRIAVLFMLITNLQTWAQENTQTVQKELPAIKTEQPPTIDGVLNDVCWQDAPKATGFTDERTEKPAKNQSVGRVVYTDTAIYVGLHLYDDMPDKIVARQTKDQTRFQGEDWVSFSLDPFHTHQFSDRNFFMANPLGTKFAHLATGRAEKSEWIGLWRVAAQIVENGWIVEMEIPWQMLDYPNTTKPVRMGINVDRFRQRTGERSWWCNLGVNEFRENDGHWIDVLPPPRKRELKVLPYLIGGISEIETDGSESEYTARAGADIRYEVTPQLRLIGTANPDFDNIEQAVEGIDFPYGERYVPDRRPFFSEGSNVYRLSRLFHSRRIMDMDGGLNLFGKIGKNTSVGTLGTYHRNNQNVIFQATQSLTATSNISAAFLSHHHRDTGANNIGYLSGDMRHGKFSVGSRFVQTSAGKSDGRNGFISVGYSGSLFQHYLSAFFVDPDFVNRLGYQPFTGYRGVGLGSFIKNEWREGFFRRASASVQSQISNTYEGEVFRRDFYVSSLILTHSDYALAAGWRGGQFEEFNDSVFSIGFRARASDRFNNVGITCNWGEQAGEPIQRISGNLNLRVYRFTAGLSSRIQWHFERRYQQILTLTYDFSPALSLGSRLIWQVEGINIYFALRRSGYAGTDFFIILGDPNASEFKQRLIAKVIRSF